MQFSLDYSWGTIGPDDSNAAEPIGELANNLAYERALEEQANAALQSIIDVANELVFRVIFGDTIRIVAAASSLSDADFEALAIAAATVGLIHNGWNFANELSKYNDSPGCQGINCSYLSFATNYYESLTAAFLDSAPG